MYFLVYDYHDEFDEHWESCDKKENNFKKFEPEKNTSWVHEHNYTQEI
jgi:hypothetical protein